MSIEEIIKLSEIHAAIDYGDEASVAKGNVAADEMRVLILEFCTNQFIEELLPFISHKTAGAWIAYSVAVFDGVTAEQMKACVDKIQSIAKSKGVTATGAEYWLKEHGYEYS